MLGQGYDISRNRGCCWFNVNYIIPFEFLMAPPSIQRSARIFEASSASLSLLCLSAISLSALKSKPNDKPKFRIIPYLLMCIKTYFIITLKIPTAPPIPRVVVGVRIGPQRSLLGLPVSIGTRQERPTHVVNGQQNSSTIHIHTNTLYQYNYVLSQRYSPYTSECNLHL